MKQAHSNKTERQDWQDHKFMPVIQMPMRIKFNPITGTYYNLASLQETSRKKTAIEIDSEMNQF